jgi:hypothetical protein
VLDSSDFYSRAPVAEFTIPGFRVESAVDGFRYNFRHGHVIDFAHRSPFFTIVFDGVIYISDVVNVFQDDRSLPGGGGTDNYITAAQKLLDQGAMVADTANVGDTDFPIEGVQNTALAGDGFASDRVVLTAPQPDNIRDPTSNDNRDQADPQAQDGLIQLAVIAEKTGNTAEKHSRQQHSGNGSNHKPEDLMDHFADKQKFIALAAKDDLF